MKNPENPSGPHEKSNDVFSNLNSLRMSQDFAESIGIEKVITKVDLSKPNKQAWVRVNPLPEFRIETGLLDFKPKNEKYLVDPSLWSELSNEIHRAVIFTTIDRSGTLGLWDIRLPDSDGKHNEWHRSALDAAQIAMKTWVRVSANQNLRGYEVTRSKANLGEPNWGSVVFEELLRQAFKDRYIDSLNHSLLRELRGES